MKRKGFTIVEVALFLGLTGILFVGIVMGTNNSIVQQRFFDSTQSYAEFLRSIYSQVSNPEGVGTGRSEELAIYGKLISFGQTVDLSGHNIPNDEQKIFVYDVVGDVVGTGTGAAVELLRNMNASVVVGDAGSMSVAGIAETYEPRWTATIETTTERGASDAADSNLYRGTILVVRHPRSGTVNTLVSPEVLPINERVIAGPNYNEARKLLMRVLCAGVNDPAMGGYNACDAALDGETVLPAGRGFSTQEVNFCVNPGGHDFEASLRWNVRLIDNARNASGVETIDLNDFDNDADSYNMCSTE